MVRVSEIEFSKNKASDLARSVKESGLACFEFGRYRLDPNFESPLLSLAHRLLAGIGAYPPLARRYEIQFRTTYIPSLIVP